MKPSHPIGRWILIVEPLKFREPFSDWSPCSTLFLPSSALRPFILFRSVMERRDSAPAKARRQPASFFLSSSIYYMVGPSIYIKEEQDSHHTNPGEYQTFSLCCYSGWSGRKKKRTNSRNNNITCLLYVSRMFLLANFSTTSLLFFSHNTCISWIKCRYE